MISKLKKRDGRIVRFDKKKITEAVFKASSSVNGTGRKQLDKLADKVVGMLSDKFTGEAIPSVEDIQDLVEYVLVHEGHYSVVKAYIMHRQKRRELREAKATLGVLDELKLPYNSIKTLSERYLLKDREGRIVESTSQLFKRVARAVAKAEKTKDRRGLEKKFYEIMSTMKFLPNSPTMFNAGTDQGTLSACFVLPIEDTMESIMKTAGHMAFILKFGGGTGFNFSNLRRMNYPISTTHGKSCGALGVLKFYNSVSDLVTQGGKRRGANMGILRVDHPEIEDFITFKTETTDSPDKFINFNTSVWVTDEFMEGAVHGEEYELRDCKGPYKKESAERIFDLIINQAWNDGNPGLIYGDTINKSNTLPLLGELEATNPCAEQPLFGHESCNLGSLNLSKFVEDKKIMFDEIEYTARLAVRFLDNIIDVNKFPLPEIEKMTKANRKIGLGVMGFADMLVKLGIPYNSKKALKTAFELMRFINETALDESNNLGKLKGRFPNFKKSIYDGGDFKHVRNATRTTIAPTGSLSLIANCSQSIEPIFAISHIRRVMGYELLEVNSAFEEEMKKEGLFASDIIRQVSGKSSIQDTSEIPKRLRKIFITAHDVSPEYHAKMQAEFQKNTDNAVSKTVNLPSSATTADVKKVYLLAYELGCKGITVYRNRSRKNQVLDVKECDSGVCEL